MKTQFRAVQGDLLIEKIELHRLPPRAKKIAPDAEGRIVLAKSEVRGHEHCFIDPRVIAWELPTETRQMLVQIVEASKEKPVLLLGGDRKSQQARLLGEPIGSTAIEGEGHFPVQITEPGFYHVPQQIEEDLIDHRRREAMD